MAFDDRCRRAFAAVVDTLLPGSGDHPGAAELGVADRFAEEVHARLPDDRARRRFEGLLRLLDSAPGGLLLYGRPQSFPDLAAEDRAEALLRMASSPLPQARFGFKALKAAAGFLYLNPPAGTDAPWRPWEAIGYPGPDPAPDGIATT